VSDWIETVEVDPTQAEIDLINRASSPFKFAETRAIEAGDVAAGIVAVFSRPLTDEERAALKAQVIALCDKVEAGLLKDFEIARGFRAYREFPGREWKLTLAGHLRTDEKKGEEPGE